MENRSAVARLGAGGRGKVAVPTEECRRVLVTGPPAPRLWWWAWEPAAAVALQRAKDTHGPGQVRLAEAA